MNASRVIGNPSSSEEPTREHWIDAARGASLCLVVLGHNLFLWDAYPGLASFIYAFHMPLFFALIGATWRRGLPGDQVAARALSLYVAYVTLSLASMPFVMLKYPGATLAEVVGGIAYGTGQTIGLTSLWFLPCAAIALLLGHFAAAGAARLLGRADGRADALACLALLGAGLVIEPFWSSYRLVRSIGFHSLAQSGAVMSFDVAIFGGSFILFGRLCRRGADAMSRWPAVRRWAVALACGALFAALYAMVMPWVDLNWRHLEPPFGAAAVAYCGVAAALFLGALVGSISLAMPLAALGRATLVVLAVHTTIQTAMTRLLLPSLPLPVVFAAAGAAAVVVPYWVDVALRRWPPVHRLIYPGPGLKHAVHRLSMAIGKTRHSP